MDVITFKNVGLKYENEPHPALKDISFSVSEGEFFALIGPSGCGKTTILKIIAGLEKPTNGEVHVPKSISFVFQFGALFPWLTVFENAALGLRSRNASNAEVEKKVSEELSLMRMEDFRDKYPADLSGGQRQRVGIARALAVDPQVLLLDEPFSALDPATTAELHRDVMELWRKKHITIVMVSHAIEEAVGLADKVILMKTGAIKHVFPIGLPHPRHEQGAAFMHEVNQVRHAFFTEA
jgi:NitT/TauT family transport system ATP-binding protein